MKPVFDIVQGHTLRYPDSLFGAFPLNKMENGILPGWIPWMHTDQNGTSSLAMPRSRAPENSIPSTFPREEECRVLLATPCDLQDSLRGGNPQGLEPPPHAPLSMVTVAALFHGKNYGPAVRAWPG
jgi:hypothetical protein